MPQPQIERQPKKKPGGRGVSSRPGEVHGRVVSSAHAEVDDSDLLLPPEQNFSVYRLAQAFFVVIMLGVGYLMIQKLSQDEVEAAVAAGQTIYSGESFQEAFEVNSQAFIDPDAFYKAEFQFGNYTQDLSLDAETGQEMTILSLKENLALVASNFNHALLAGEDFRFADLINGNEWQVLTQGERDQVAFQVFLTASQLEAEGEFAQVAKAQDLLRQMGYKRQAALLMNFEAHVEPTVAPVIAEIVQPAVNQQIQADQGEQVGVKVAEESQDDPSPQTAVQEQTVNNYSQVNQNNVSANNPSADQFPATSNSSAHESVLPLFVVANPTLSIPLSVAPNTNLQSSFAGDFEVSQLGEGNGVWIDISLSEFIKLAARFFNVTELAVISSTPVDNGYSLTLNDATLGINISVWANQAVPVGDRVPLGLITFQ